MKDRPLLNASLLIMLIASLGMLIGISPAYQGAPSGGYGSRDFRTLEGVILAELDKIPKPHTLPAIAHEVGVAVDEVLSEHVEDCRRHNDLPGSTEYVADGGFKVNRWHWICDPGHPFCIGDRSLHNTGSHSILIVDGDEGTPKLTMFADDVRCR